MEQSLERALVRNLLERASEQPWRVQEIGVLALWLDDERSYRVHVWDPESAVGEPPIHDHPFDFTSSVVVGELVNTRYVECAEGQEYVRERYSPGDEDARRADTLRLAGTPESVCAGSRYRQVARELHDSRPTPGTVTIMRFDWRVADMPQLTVCRRPDADWTSGVSRAASPEEVQRITGMALERFRTRSRVSPA